MEQAIFTNDNNVQVRLLNHEFSPEFTNRHKAEPVFRQINTFLINQKVIKRNIIDLGAWIGDNSIPWALNIEGIVYAIDPSPNNCDFIQRTCELNNISNVKIFETAISNVSEVLSTHDNINHCSFITSLNGPLKVNAVSLDHLYQTKSIENVGYIHLDVEGMEYKILEGSVALIEQCRPLISFEQHLEIDNYDIILSYLKKKNYTIFLINEILPGCRHDCRNSFAFPNEIYNETLINNINAYIGTNILIYK
jgi:FkbM family methyltransferase